MKNHIGIANLLPYIGIANILPYDIGIANLLHLYYVHTPSSASWGFHIVTNKHCLSDEGVHIEHIFYYTDRNFDTRHAPVSVVEMPKMYIASRY